MGWQSMDAFVPNDFWAAVETLLPLEPEKLKKGGQPRAGGRDYLGVADRNALEAPATFRIRLQG
jgi:hypothetical protein